MRFLTIMVMLLFVSSITFADIRAYWILDLNGGVSNATDCFNGEPCTAVPFTFWEEDPFWTGNESRVTNLETSNTTTNGRIDNLIDNCPAGEVAQNLTASGLECIVPPAGAEADPLWSGNSSSVARVGNCPSGQVVQNTTTSGVSCIVPPAGAEADPLWSGNASAVLAWNETYADTLYYPLDTNPNNYWNDTWAGFNKTYADTLYSAITWNKTYADTLYYPLTTNPNNYWNDTWAGFNKTYADTLYSEITWNKAYADTLYVSRTPTWCYQEDAESSTEGDGSCNQIYAGSYTCSDGWNPAANCTKTYDKSWGTSGIVNSTVGTNASNIIVYEKPENTTSAIWTFEDASFTVYNYSIPKSCWDYNATSIKLNMTSSHGSSAPTRTAYFSCWNGTWVLIHNAGDNAEEIYEDGIYWNIPQQEVDPFWTGNESRVTDLETSNTTTNGRIDNLIDNCPAGEVAQNLTASGLECIVPPAGAEADPLWSGNASAVLAWNETYADTLYYPLDTNPNNYWNDTWAGFNKTYADTLYSAITWNKTYADTLYYPLTTNPNNYWNDTWAGFNKTYADTLYSEITWNKTYADTLYSPISEPLWSGNASAVLAWNETYADTLYYPLDTNPNNYWNDTWAGFNKTYADTLYAGISEPLWSGNSSNVARTGSCSVNQFGIATTTSGVTCAQPSTSNVTEGTNLYYTDARARTATSMTGAATNWAATSTDKGLLINTTTAKPTCDSSARGGLWLSQGTAGNADYLYVCMKNSADSYNWVQVAIG